MAIDVDSTPRSQLDRLLVMARPQPPLRTAVVHPCDPASLAGALEACREGLIIPVLVGPRVAIVAAVETVQPNMVATLHAAALAKMAERDPVSSHRPASRRYRGADSTLAALSSRSV